jgi:hypothetical protein
VADEVVLVDSLHNDNDDAGFLAVEPAQQGIVEPLVCCRSLGFRQGVIGFEWVVQDDDVSSPSGEDAPD